MLDELEAFSSSDLDDLSLVHPPATSTPVIKRKKKNVDLEGNSTQNVSFLRAFRHDFDSMYLDSPFPSKAPGDCYD